MATEWNDNSRLFYGKQVLDAKAAIALLDQGIIPGEYAGRLPPGGIEAARNAQQLIVERLQPQLDAYDAEHSPLMGHLLAAMNPSALLTGALYGGAGLLGLTAVTVGTVAAVRAARKHSSKKRSSPASSTRSRTRRTTSRAARKEKKEREARSPAKGTGTEKQFKHRGGKAVHYTKHGQPWIYVRRRNSRTGKMQTMPQFVKRSKKK